VSKIVKYKITHQTIYLSKHENKSSQSQTVPEFISKKLNFNFRVTFALIHNLNRNKTTNYTDLHFRIKILNEIFIKSAAIYLITLENIKQW